MDKRFLIIFVSHLNIETMKDWFKVLLQAIAAAIGAILGTGV